MVAVRSGCATKNMMGETRLMHTLRQSVQICRTAEDIILLMLKVHHIRPHPGIPPLDDCSLFGVSD